MKIPIKGAANSPKHKKFNENYDNFEGMKICKEISLKKKIIII
jgi:hypothetical protein